MSVTILTSIILFILGLIIGSFLNVVILRLNTAKSFGGRSACMSCCNTLCWYELIPFFSFLGLGGRCRHCKTKISLQYPLVELITGITFVILFLQLASVQFGYFEDLLNFKFLFTYAYYAVMFSILIIITTYDCRHKIIPDSLSLLFGVLAFVGLFLFSHFTFFPHVPTLLEFLSGFIISLPFALLWMVSRGAWMGFGDAKLALGLGWFLGLPLAFSAVVIAFWTGAICGLGLIVISPLFKTHKHYGMKSEIPFALYLTLGTFLAFIFEFNFFQIL